MENEPSGRLREHFGDLPDPRIDRTKLHKLLDIVLIAICAVICGADDWVEVAIFVEAKEQWFRTFLELKMAFPRMIPSIACLPGSPPMLSGSVLWRGSRR